MLNLPVQIQIILLPIIVFSIVIHEFSHTYVAILLGDKSPSNMARLTLNPMKHLDPVGALMIYVFGFGYAKPVRINNKNFKKPIRDEIIVGLAGPASNFILSFIVLIIFRLVLDNFDISNEYVIYGFQYAAIINIGLGVFNLIPIPPLDGSHLYTSWLFKHHPEIYRKVLRYGTFVLLGLIILSRATPIDFLPIGSLVEGIYYKMATFIFS